MLTAPLRRPGRGIKQKGAAVAAALFLSLPLAPGAALAQQAGADGSSVTVEQRVDEVRPGAQPLETGDPAKPPTLESAPDAAPDAVVDPDPDAFPAFVLAGVAIEGASALSVEALAPAYEPYLARLVDADGLAEIAGGVTARYREAGYILTRAEIPPQSVESGVLRVRVIEGYIAETRVDGLEGATAARAAARLRTLEDVRPARLASMDRASSLVGDLAGVRVTDRQVEPMGAPGAHRLIVTAEAERLDAVVYADNRGDREVGPMLAWFGVGVNDALGAGERIEGGVYTVPDSPKELLYGEARVIAPLGGDGTKGDVALSGSSSESGGNQRDADLISRSRTVTLGVEHPLILRRAEDLTLRGEVRVSRLSEEQRDIQTYEDRTRIVSLSLDYARTGLFDGTDVSGGLALDQGLDVLDANTADDPDNSLADGSGAFTKLRGRAAVTQALPAQLSTHLAFRGQLADRALLTGEQFQLGGGRFGRAYGYGEVSGEHGLAGLIEVRRTGRLDLLGLGGYQLYGFADLGAVWDRTSAGGFDRESLASAGGGVRLWSPGYGFYADAQLAQPLIRDPDATDDDAPRFFLGLSGDF